MTIQFSKRVIHWFEQNGRHDLPWQKKPTPYRVWVSEIMLQQTQVNTVIPYYLRFIKKFPNVKTLANAELDEVLLYWSGLGYYARARNLHKTANIIHHQYRGHFPKELAQLIELPGIGKSTAGAILSLAMQQSATILDGNVKRVLARHFLIDVWPGSSEGQKQFWQLAESLTPKSRCSHYNQAMMDLGATTCIRTKPKCTICPISTTCLASATDKQAEFPVKKPKKERPKRKSAFLILQRNHNNHREILLEKRPEYGIWGGLWSFPEHATGSSFAEHCRQHYQCNIVHQQRLDIMTHQFSHFELEIHPYLIEINPQQKAVMDSNPRVWYKLSDELPGGIPQPIRKIMATLK